MARQSGFHSPLRENLPATQGLRGLEMAWGYTRVGTPARSAEVSVAQVLKSQFCANHPERAARAVCVSCRKAVCPECATQWEGINFCVQCLRTRREKTVAQSSASETVLVLAAIVVLFFTASYLMMWAGVNLARIF